MKEDSGLEGFAMELICPSEEELLIFSKLL